MLCLRCWLAPLLALLLVPLKSPAFIPYSVRDASLIVGLLPHRGMLVLRMVIIFHMGYQCYDLSYLVIPRVFRCYLTHLGFFVVSAVIVGD